MSRTSVIVSLFLGGLVGCGKPPAKPFSGSPNLDARSGVAVDNNGNPIAAADVPVAASLAAFEANVYTPILGPFCANGCHVHNENFAPRMTASAEGEEPMPPPAAALERAHNEFLKRVNFNSFAGVDQTPAVLKMDYKSGGHNCWDAELKKCYDGMSAAINGWLKDLEAAGYKPTPVVYPNATAAVDFKTATPITAKFDPGDYVIGSIDAATLAAPFVKGTDDIDGPIKSYAMAPAGTAAGGNAAVVAQAITFNMNVTKAAPYHAWARVKTPAGTKSRFFFSNNNAAAVQYLPPVTTDAWKWVRVNVVANNAATENPLALNLAAGTIPMKVIYRDPEAKINMLVLTSRLNDFNGELFSNDFFDVKVPLKVAGVEGASIIATVWKKTTGDGKKSLGVKELKIESPVPLHVKNIKPLINNLFYSNHATYTIVDTVAGGANPVIQTGGSTASVWIADLDVDKLSFSFETIEVAP